MLLKPKRILCWCLFGLCTTVDYLRPVWFYFGIFLIHFRNSKQITCKLCIAKRTWIWWVWLFCAVNCWLLNHYSKLKLNENTFIKIVRNYTFMTDFICFFFELKDLTDTQKPFEQTNYNTVDKCINESMRIKVHWMLPYSQN